MGIIHTPQYDCVSESVNERMLVRANVKAEVRPREGSRADLSHYQCLSQQHLTLNIIYRVTDKLIYTKLNLEPNKNLLTFRNTRSGDLIQTPWISITYWLCFFKLNFNFNLLNKSSKYTVVILFIDFLTSCSKYIVVILPFDILYINPTCIARLLNLFTMHLMLNQSQRNQN